MTKIETKHGWRIEVNEIGNVSGNSGLQVDFIFKGNLKQTTQIWSE